MKYTRLSIIRAGIVAAPARALDQARSSGLTTFCFKSNTTVNRLGQSTRTDDVSISTDKTSFASRLGGRFDEPAN